MRKSLYHILAILFVALTSISVSAQTFTLSECDHKIAGGSGFGSDSPGEISAAMFIPGTRLKSLAGNEITRIDVGLISRINVREVTVWVRKNLDGDNLASGSIERGKLGWNEVTLEKSYTIETDCPGLYIGFNYQNTGSSHPVSILGEAGDFTTWLKTSENGKWEDMTSRGVLSIEAIITGSNLPKYNLSLNRAEISPDPSEGENCYVVSGTVSNVGMKKISGFEVTVSEGSVESGKGKVNLDIEPGKTLSFSAKVKADKTINGEVTVSISSLNEGKDADTTDNAAVATVVFSRNVLLEEFTTEQCPNCPEGARMVHSVLEDPFYASHTVPVCHHSTVGTDFLTRECDTDLLWMFGPEGQVYAPSAMFNRIPTFKKGLTMAKEEPIVALRSEEDIKDCIEKALAIPAHAMVGLSIVDKSEGSIVIDVNVITDSEFNATDPRLVFYTLEDNVKAQYQQGAGADYYHQHVIRTDNGSWGEELTFENGNASRQFTITLDPSWKRSDISFVAFIANRDSEVIANNVVENVASVRLEVPAPSSVNEVAEASSAIDRYFDISGQKVTPDTKGLVIKVSADGKVRKIMNR